MALQEGSSKGHEAERLGLPPVHCVVVEDAPAGLEGARREADLVVESLERIDTGAFDALVAVAG